MRKVAYFLKKYFTADGVQSTTTPPSTTRPNVVDPHHPPWPSGGNPTRSHRPPPSGVTVADRPIGERRERRHRRRRRTQSPVGLPLYSEEPRDQEMSLFKHQTSDMNLSTASAFSTSRLDLTLSPTIEVDGVLDDEEEDDDASLEPRATAGEEGDEGEEQGGGVEDDGTHGIHRRSRPRRDLVDDSIDDSSASEFVRPSFDISTTDGDHLSRVVSHTTSLMPPPSTSSNPGSSFANPTSTSVSNGSALSIMNRPRSASESMVRLTRSSSRVQTPDRIRNNPYGSNSSSPFASRSGLIDLPPGNLSTGGGGGGGTSLSPTVSRDGHSTPPRSFFGHRTTRSSPMMPHSPSLSPSTPPRASTNSAGGGGGRPRASTLQRVLGGGRNSSSSSFSSLNPGGSATTMMTSPGGLVARAAGGGGGSPGGSGRASPTATRSLTRFKNASQASINTLDISEPVPGSFVHSSFVFPRTGPTPEQVRFIASRESLGAYGYFGHGSPVDPPPFDGQGSPSMSSGAPAYGPPPPVGQAGEVGAGSAGSGLADLVSSGNARTTTGSSIAAAVQGRGRSGSTASSPLARRDDDEDDEGDRRAAQEPRTSKDRRRSSLVPFGGRSEDRPAESRADVVSDLPFAVDDEAEPRFAADPTHVASPSPVPPCAAPSLEPSLFAPLVRNDDVSDRPIPPPFQRLNTSSPPPQIFTLPATPVSSTFPSPAIEHASSFSDTTARTSLDRDETVKIRR
ncbi:hypothetical protein JCM10212_002362 [Sporobolomyces blumeae]